MNYMREDFPILEMNNYWYFIVFLTENLLLLNKKIQFEGKLIIIFIIL